MNEEMNSLIKLNNIYKEDCISFMQRMREENVLVDVIVTSPPYNIEKDYGSYTDDMSRDEYLDWMEKIAELSKSILKENGSFFLNIAGRPIDPMSPFLVAN
jgi:site-specific DNA-methyltransferase (adenine-specific)